MLRGRRTNPGHPDQILEDAPDAADSRFPRSAARAWRLPSG